MYLCKIFDKKFSGSLIQGKSLDITVSKCLAYLFLLGPATLSAHVIPMGQRTPENHLGHKSGHFTQALLIKVPHILPHSDWATGQIDT